MAFKRFNRNNSQFTTQIEAILRGFPPTKAPFGKFTERSRSKLQHFAACISLLIAKPPIQTICIHGILRAQNRSGSVRLLWFWEQLAVTISAFKSVTYLKTVGTTNYCWRQNPALVDMVNVM